ncbi:MAG TPA: class I SAM-dependent methyltransferase [Candidatus Alistipes intestinigallinarum]|uniref:Class I SAM-dependent methyltransferase n=1 Tax=Candidatus Alistipes intestinigallinarum TaxID=2838440 RepID=A0A9D1Z2R1_9BACT|nr:class I SAM-dependent methyltransferase [Candidatus Alistipes intestinigallinarum]
MAKINTAERVSREASDNFVFQRSLLAYHAAAERIAGDVLEIGTGAGYGIEVVAPKAQRFVTLDKHRPAAELLDRSDVEFRQAVVPPLAFPDASFDCVISFQVIEHIRDDRQFVREIHRVLRPGGRFIVTTPNAPMSLTRNPWHVREYTADELRQLLGSCFASVEALGVFGNEQVADYYEKNRRGVERITRFDPLDLQHRLPRWMLQIPYDLLNRLNRRRLLRENNDLTTSIRMEDYRLGPAAEGCYDLFFIATK